LTAVYTLCMSRISLPRNEQIHIKVKAEEKDAFVRQAQARGLSLSAWIRLTLLDGARKGDTPWPKKRSASGSV